MAQTLGEDLVPKLNQNIATIEESIIPNIRKGFDNTREIATESGSDKLVKSCDSAEAGVEANLQAFTELVELLRNVVKQYTKVQEAL